MAPVDFRLGVVMVDRRGMSVNLVFVAFVVVIVFVQAVLGCGFEIEVVVEDMPADRVYPAMH